MQVPDVAALFEAFAAGIRAVHGKLLVAGIPRMTSRARSAGNHETGPALENAVVQADSRVTSSRLKILTASLAHERATASAADVAAAGDYLAELRES